MMLINKRIHKRILDKKKKLDSLRPLPPAFVTRLKEQMTIEYTYNTNSIEGNTLTLHETRLVIEEGITLGGKSVSEVLEAKNHPEALEFIESIVATKHKITEDNVLHVHRLILSKIVDDAGCYRTTNVRIAGASFSPPLSSEVKSRMNELLNWLSDNPDEYTPIELGAVFHHRYVQIHPFTEGNGRTARLLLNAILLKAGYPFIVIVSKYDRSKYLKGLMETDLGNPSTFVNFIAQSVEKALDMYLIALEEPRTLTLTEASKITPYSQEYLSLMARKGIIGAFKRGRNWMITEADLMKYMDSVRKKT